MQIKQLELDNILSYKILKIDFDDLDFTLFKGKMGSGKSNIFDGLCWALYGRTARKKYDKAKVIRNIPSQQNSGFGRVVLADNDGTEYTIERRVAKTESISLLKNGQPIDIRTKTMTQEALNEVLGRDYHIFIHSAYFGQRDIGAFVNSTSSERISVISDILSLSEYDKASEKCRLETLRLENKLAEHSGQIKTYMSLISREDERALLREKKIIKAALEKNLDRQTTLSQALVNLRKKKELTLELASIKNKYDAEKRIAENKIADLKSQRAAIKEKLKERGQFEKELKELSDELKELDATKSNLKRSKENLRNIESEMQEIVSQRTAAYTLKQRMEELRRRKRCPECGSSVSDMEKRLDKEESALATKIEGFDGEIDRLQKDTKQVESRIEALEGRLNLLTEVEIKKSAIQSKLQQFDDYEQQLQKIDIKSHVKAANEVLDSIKKDYSKAKKTLKNFDDYDLDDMPEYEEELSKLGRSEVEKTARQSQLTATIKKLRQAKTELKKLQDDAKKIEEMLAMAAFWKKEFVKLKLRVIAEAVPLLQGLANEYISNVIPYVSLKFPVTTSGKQNKMEIDVYDHRASKSPAVRIIEGWNGGTKDLLSLACFMALNKIASMKAQKSLDFMFADEKFASLGDSVCQVIEMLRQEYEGRKLFCISHVDGLEDMFSQVFEVTEKNGVSNVKRDR